MFFAIGVASFLLTGCGSQGGPSSGAAQVGSQLAHSTSKSGSDTLVCGSTSNFLAGVDIKATGSATPLAAAKPNFPEGTVRSTRGDKKDNRQVFTAYNASNDAIARVTVVHQNDSWLAIRTERCE